LGLKKICVGKTCAIKALYIGVAVVVVQRPGSSGFATDDSRSKFGPNLHLFALTTKHLDKQKNMAA